jgi:hypothetical protein
MAQNKNNLLLASRVPSAKDSRYYGDLRKMPEDYPGWEITKPLDQMVEEVVIFWRKRTT